MQLIEDNLYYLINFGLIIYLIIIFIYYLNIV